MDALPRIEGMVNASSRMKLHGDLQTLKEVITESQNLGLDEKRAVIYDFAHDD